MFIQALGRAGRDHKPAKSTVFYNATDIGANVLHMSDSMRKYCTLTTCRRRFITDHFGASPSIVSPMHACCDNCEQACGCDTCTTDTAMETDGIEDLELVPADQSVVSYAEPMLLNYFHQENNSVSRILPQAQTGLSEQFAKHLAKYANVYCDRGTIGYKYQHIDSFYLDNISQLLTAILHRCK